MRPCTLSLRVCTRGAKIFEHVKSHFARTCYIYIKIPQCALVRFVVDSAEGFGERNRAAYESSCVQCVHKCIASGWLEGTHAGGVYTRAGRTGAECVWMDGC